MLEMRALPVGLFEANCYLLSDPATKQGILIDPGAQAEVILAWLGDIKISRILITHGDSDHVGALAEVRDALSAPAGIHPLDGKHIGVQADFDINPGDEFALGGDKLEAVFLPGHTPGSLGFRVIEGGEFYRAIVGDAVFPGGPGRTSSHENLRTSLDALQRTVFTWSDEVALHPGHGKPTTVGAERQAFEAFIGRPLPPDLYGDVTWR